MAETKLIAGGMGGVFVPILIEFGVKGQRISEQIPFKWSGVIGVGGGLAVGILPLAWKGHPVNKMAAENKNAAIAFGASMFATGASILILDELKKQAAYTFGEVPLGLPHSEGLIAPPEEMIKEI